MAGDFHRCDCRVPRSWSLFRGGPAAETARDPRKRFTRNFHFLRARGPGYDRHSRGRRTETWKMLFLERWSSEERYGGNALCPGPGTFIFPDSVPGCREGRLDWNWNGIMRGLRGGVSRKSQNQRKLIFSWAQGFMSGLNTDLLDHRETNLNELSMGTQKQLVRSYCSDHPHAAYFQAVFNLYNRMRGDQGLPSYYKIWHEPPKGR
jgi:hypothetical protein